MGYGVARSALRAGHVAFGFVVNDKRRRSFVADDGSKVALAEIAGELDPVTVVVLNAAQTEEVLLIRRALSRR